MTDLEIIKKIYSTIDNMQFTFIKDDMLYFKTDSNIRLKMEHDDSTELFISYRENNIHITDWVITITGYARNVPHQTINSWREDENDNTYGNHTWMDISSEEDFFQKSLILDYGDLTYEFITIALAIRDKVSEFIDNDPDTCYRIGKYKWNKRKRR